MTGRDYLDVMVQHHIARGLAVGTLPQAAVVEIAETIGAADWKDRGLDVAAEIERRFAGLVAERRSPDAIAASLRRDRRNRSRDATRRGRSAGKRGSPAPGRSANRMPSEWSSAT